MPTYSYACKSCGHQFDIVQAFSDNALTDCPECGGTLRKVFNSVGVVFKGSGFYRTDSRGSSTSTSTSSATSPESATSAGDSPTKSVDSGSSSGAASTGGSAPKSSGATGSTASD